MLLVGLTGGIVAGKTTVARMFSELGAEVIDADQIAREIMQPGKKIWKEVVLKFGSEIIDDHQEIDRNRLARIVFSDQEKLECLNKITHPEITLKIKEQIRDIQKHATQDVICMIDAPLLFEAEMNDWMDKIIVVYINREEQIKRLFQRNGLSRSEAIKRIDAQISLEKKVLLADYVIDNRESVGELKDQVVKVWKDLLRCLHA
ncbi:MAG: dephospho-CoA kinase [Candidatus Atribacteria bacterium]|nr:dephospho-CoA kinase [Candidatus Atribacteria bacterium]